MKAEKRKPNSKDLPDRIGCCASEIGLQGFAECQISGPNQCPYAMPFGYSFLCHHPHVDKLVARNKERQKAVALN